MARRVLSGGRQSPPAPHTPATHTRGGSVQKTNRWFAKGRALVSLVALVLSACPTEKVEVEEKRQLAVTNPLRKPTEITREYVAQIRAFQHIEVRALERGYLQDIFVDEGQFVKSGQRMFQIMPMIYQAEVQKAQAETERAQIEYDNTRALAEKNVVSQNELAIGRANFNKAQAQLNLATTHQGLTQIRAPFGGMMGLFSARKGSLVDEGDLLTTLSDNSTMWVYFNVTEAEYLTYKAESEGKKPWAVRLLMADGKIFDQPGVVETIEADFDNETGAIAFRATFPNPKQLLRHGETGKILVSETLDDALVIPQAATFDVLDKKYVFVVDEQNVVRSRAITVKAELPQVYVVAKGVDEKDKILLEGLRKVREGSVIEPKYQKPVEVLAHLEAPSE
ncbi:MAG: efflux RND transporter periplasmic adaptor subunit [Archangiaceae bacterium]|nr:efflux RND transporter periplasmic adaptor subunit [Archangiaceae bacterium]